MAGEGVFTIRVTVVTLTGVEQSAVPADPKRVGIMFSQSNAFGNVQAKAKGWPNGDWAVKLPDTGFLDWKYKDWGPLVAGAWNVQANAMGGTVSVLELLAFRE